MSGAEYRRLARRAEDLAERAVDGDAGDEAFRLRIATAAQALATLALADQVSTAIHMLTAVGVINIVDDNPTSD